MKKRKTFLSFSPPMIGEEEIAEVVDTLRSDWITTGPKTKRFEEDFRKFIGAESAIALNSCTSALHVALLAAGIGPGDSVITSPMTFCSGVSVIEQTGAKPVLVDVEPDTLNLDPEKIEQAIKSGAGKKIKAIMPVHYGGHPCDMDAILDIARRHGLTVIEDAAHALPAKYKGRLVGTLGDLTAFSFYATKNLTTAEGGMLTGSAKLVEKAKIFGLHGIDRDAWDRYSEKGSWYYEVVARGYKYNMTDIQAAIGIHQLRKLPKLQARRVAIAKRYDAVFSKLEELAVPMTRPEVESAWHLYAIQIEPKKLGISRNQFIDELKARNIGTSVHFIPVHLHPYYRDAYGYRPEDFPVAYEKYQRVISLPIYPKMTDQDAADVIDAVTDVVRKYKK